MAWLLLLVNGLMSLYSITIMTSKFLTIFQRVSIYILRFDRLMKCDPQSCTSGRRVTVGEELVLFGNIFDVNQMLATLKYQSRPHERGKRPNVITSSKLSIEAIKFSSASSLHSTGSHCLTFATQPFHDNRL
jgi:hypothetical protein